MSPQLSLLSCILKDEDFAQDIQLHLLEISKGGYVRAQDVVDYIDRPEVQERLGKKTKISLRTAQRWLKKLSWRYGRKRNGMYIDGHEREDVVKYRNKFIVRWNDYKKRMVLYDGDGNVVSTPKGFDVAQRARFQLIPVTHDESTFYAEDRRENYWHPPGQKPVPERKGEGESLMVTEFLAEWGRLKDKQLPVLIQSLWLTQCYSVRLVSYLKRAKIVTAISRQTT